MKTNNLHMVSLTIENNSGTNIDKKKTKSSNTLNIKSIKKTHKQIKLNETSKTHKYKTDNSKLNSLNNSNSSKNLKNSNHIHQIFIIAINDINYNKENSFELLEIARVSGNAIFNDSSVNNCYFDINGSPPETGDGFVVGSATFKGQSTNKKGVGSVILAYDKGINGSNILGIF